MEANEDRAPPGFTLRAATAEDVEATGTGGSKTFASGSRPAST